MGEWRNGSGFEKIRLYNPPLVFDDVLDCLGWQKEGVRNDFQVFGSEDWVDNGVY